MAVADGPLVTVAVSTYNRADLLPQSIGSVLAQTMGDLEVVIVDDGSTDHTREVVESFDDPRVRYAHQANQGIATARNHAADLARGRYTAVHDDDDIMLPWRLERQLETIRPGAAGAYGSFVNFDDVSGDLVFHHGRGFTHGAVLLTGFAPGHSTWLVRTDLIRTFRYDETLTSAVDNNLALRMLRSGVHLHHSGVMCVLRRVHGLSVTAADATNQNRAAAMSRSLLRTGMSAADEQRLRSRATGDWGLVSGRNNFDEILTPFLPDTLSDRTVAFTAPSSTAGADDVTVGDAEGTELSRYHCAGSMSLVDLFATYRRGGDVIVRQAPVDGPGAADWVDDVCLRLVDHHVAELAAEHPGAAVIWCRARPDQADRLRALSPGGQVRMVAQRDTRSALVLSAPLPVRDAAYLQGRLRQEGVRDVRLRHVDQHFDQVLAAVREMVAGRLS